MRVLPIVIALVCVAIPIPSIARPKPKIAIAPLQGDGGDKIARAVAGALAGKDFAVVGPRDTGRELTRLGAGDELSPKDVRKLARKLGVIAVVDGKVGKAGKKRSLHLEVHRRGKPDAGFTLEFKTTASEGFRRAVRQEIIKKLDGATEDPDEDDDRPVASADDEDRKRSLAAADDEDRKRKQADDDAAAARRARKADDDDAPRRARKAGGGDDEDGRKARRVAEADEPAVRKRKGKKLGDEAPSALVLARVGAGASVAQRRLSYSTRAGFTQAPPPVITTAGGGRIDGELYPFALASARSAAAGLGLAGSYDKTFGLRIKVPGQAVSAPINQSHYALGARYRFGVGAASSIALGLDYAGRSYVADRSGLMSAVLDTPDFRYTAIAPGISARTSVTPAIALFGGVDGMIVLDAGAVTKNVNYGMATVYGVEAVAGLELALTKQIGLRIALEYSQLSFAFGGKGALASGRDNDANTQDVMGAVDRYIGGVATLGLAY